MDVIRLKKMADPLRVKCDRCDREILEVTAIKTDGMCRPCFREANLTDAEKYERKIFDHIDSIIEPFESYSNALKKLSGQPDGYRFCFAFHYVNADILNGGISQLYGNSTWCLILDAISAAETSGHDEVAETLLEIVYYYHRKGRSKLKRRLRAEIFNDFSDSWDKSLSEIDDAYFKLDESTENIIPSLCANMKHLF